MNIFRTGMQSDDDPEFWTFVDGLIFNSIKSIQHNIIITWPAAELGI
jgi:hypothetical protein